MALVEAHAAPLAPVELHRWQLHPEVLFGYHILCLARRSRVPDVRSAGFNLMSISR